MKNVRIWQRQTVGDGGELGSVRDGILLEGSIDRVARALSLLAEGFVTLSAELALVAGVGDPLDSDIVADLELGLLIVKSNDVYGSDHVSFFKPPFRKYLARCRLTAGTFVSTDERELVVDGPVA